MLEGEERARAVNQLRDFIRESQRILVITGAGASTASGIPDYRGKAGSYKTGHKPISHQDFMRHEDQRKRYWSRSFVGFETFDGVKPNKCHEALAALERAGKVEHLITQNVDGLHHQAGSTKITDLHGRIDRVRCLECGGTEARAVVQESLRADNSGWLALHASRAEQRADGDAELGRSADHSSFVLPACPHCAAAGRGDGFLKPDVVFFGDNVPKATVEKCFAHADECDALLVVGSSLEVYSAYRFVLRVAGQPHEGGTKPGPERPPGQLPNRQKPLCVLNLGTTRAERSGVSPLLKIHLPCDEALWEAATAEGLL